MSRDPIKASVTSSDVARLADVSQSAVSRTFTPGASVSAKTRARVMAAADQLGYRPNRLAQSLISGRSGTIGLVVAYLENHFYPMVIEALSLALQERGYHVLLFMTTPGEQDEVIKEIMQYKVEGVVLASVTLSSHITEECAKVGVPVLLFNRYIPDSRASSVVSDNESGGQQVAEYLLNKGYSKIAFVAGQEDSSTSLERERGFRLGLEKQGVLLWKKVIGNYLFEQAANAAHELLNGDDKPDAIFVANDHMAFSVMDVIRRDYQLRIPEDVAIVGFDNVPEAAWAAYDLTTVGQPVERMVEETVLILIEQMQNKQVIPKHRAVSVSIIERGST